MKELQKRLRNDMEIAGSKGYSLYVKYNGGIASDPIKLIKLGRKWATVMHRSGATKKIAVDSICSWK